MDQSKTILTRGTHCKNEYVLKYCTYLAFYETADFGGEIQTASKSNFHSVYGVNGPFLDYLIEGCTRKKRVFSEIWLLFLFV